MDEASGSVAAIVAETRGDLGIATRRTSMLRVDIELVDLDAVLTRERLLQGDGDLTLARAAGDLEQLLIFSRISSRVLVECQGLSAVLAGMGNTTDSSTVRCGDDGPLNCVFSDVRKGTTAVQPVYVCGSEYWIITDKDRRKGVRLDPQKIEKLADGKFTYSGAVPLFPEVDLPNWIQV